MNDNHQDWKLNALLFTGTVFKTDASALGNATFTSRLTKPRFIMRLGCRLLINRSGRALHAYFREQRKNGCQD
jgi:hypothetical protein